jgi:hypothetical protein
MPAQSVGGHERYRQQLLHQQAPTLNAYQNIANTQYIILQIDSQLINYAHLSIQEFSQLGFA